MNNNEMRIFTADDDPDILTIMQMMLRTKQYQVEASTNANDIFNNREYLPDLILMDIWMSGLDGRDICSRIKKDERLKDIPVVFISANSNIKEITEQYGAVDYISKPFEMEFFLNKVQHILEARHVKQ